MVVHIFSPNTGELKSGPSRCASPFPNQTSHLPRSSAPSHGLEASKTNLAPWSRGRRRCRHITACAAKCVREEVCAERGGRGLERKSGFLRPGARLQAARPPRCHRPRRGPRAHPSEPEQPRDLDEKTVTSAPPVAAAPPLALGPSRSCTQGPQKMTPRRQTPSRPSPAPPRASLLRARSCKALQIYRRQERR
ncbi:uncharacterized protein LOC143441225 [Arvicanthis niloticus]|uniref:uncharacterized protein LOC143311443 n=1 Tax=Arvicanthis niloticus TaxID=61156 RepID=UPI00402B6709